MNALISKQFAARKLAVSVRKLEQMVRDGVIPFVDFGDGEFRFDERDLAEFANQRRREPALSGAT